MSLYDMYFSKKNKNYMYELISKLIKEETDIDISNSPKHIELYRQNYSTIFETVNTDEISILNKELINHIGKIFLNSLHNTETYNPDLIHDSEKVNDSVQIIENKLYKKFIIHSSKRNKNSLNRYDFNININCNEYQPKNIILIKENNNLFSNPTIIVRFNDDNLHFSLTETKTFNDKEYYTYECITDDLIQCKDILNIKILNYLMIPPLDKSDMYTIKMMKKIKYENKDYLCLEISDNDINENDELGLVQLTDNTQQIIKSLFVKKCIQNYILTNLEDIDLEKSYSCLQLNKNIEIRGLLR